MKKDDCIFCKLANGIIPTNTIFEDEDFRVILDASPATRGHMLILPKEHFDNIFELDDETSSKLFKRATKLSKAIKQNLKCDGLNILQNNGEIAGQTVFHFHMHLIPRYKDDNVTINWNHLNLSDEETKKIIKEVNSF